MADTTNLSKFLGDVADAIRTKKETTEPIPASEFDQEILSIDVGIDTSDATATAEDIIYGKTAYVNGKRIEGVIETSSYDNVMNDTDIIVSNSLLNNTDNAVRFGINNLNPDGETKRIYTNIGLNVKNSRLADHIGLTPEKLIKGETVLDVKGTAESGGSSADEDAPKHYVFNSEAEAELFTDFKNRDTVVILGEQTRPLSLENYISSGFRRTAATGIDGGLIWWCKDTVVLPKAMEYSDEYIKSENGNKNVSQAIKITLTPTYCEIYFQYSALKNDYEGYARWESVDGITYTFSGRRDSSDMDLDINYFRLDGILGRAYNQIQTLAVELIDGAITTLTSPEIFGFFIELRAKDAFSGFWQIGTQDTVETVIHSIDLKNSSFGEVAEDCSIVVSRERYNMNEQASLITQCALPTDASYGKTLVDVGDYIFVGYALEIRYYRESDEFYLLKHTSNDTVCKRYNTTTGELIDAATSSIDGVTAYYKLPKDAVIAEFTINSDYTPKSFSAMSTIYVYDTVGGNELYFMYNMPRGDIRIVKNDFGAYATSGKLHTGEYALTNEGVIVGNYDAPEITSEEEQETITILDTIIGGEE